MRALRTIVVLVAVAGAVLAVVLLGREGARSAPETVREAAPAARVPGVVRTEDEIRELKGDRSAHLLLPVDRSGWKTDFSRHSVPLHEFARGGPPRDGIPPIDDPKPVQPSRADRWLEDREPVLVVRVGDAVRAYPVQILVWHEIVNDRLGGRSIAVTYCPLCNSSLVFDRDLPGVGVLRLGTTGNLRRSDLVMWDDRTESWWQQITGEAVVGRLTGRRLAVLPSQTLSWADVKARHPDADVLSRDTGHDRPYGRTPYASYDRADSEPLLLPELADRRLPPKERVVAIRAGDRAAVVPFSRLRRDPVAHVRVGGRRVVVFYARGVTSALDSRSIARSRDVGTAGAFDARLGGRRLRFEAAGDGRFRDVRTGSAWDVSGRAVGGPLRGRRLRPVVGDQQFWFAIAAFVPRVRIVR